MPAIDSLASDVPADTRPGGDVVVGYEGSWHSTPALERAAVEAVQRRVGRTLLMVVATTGVPRLAEQAQREAASARWDEADAAAQSVRRRHPGLVATTCLLPDGDLDGLRRRLTDTLPLVLVVPEADRRRDGQVRSARTARSPSDPGPVAGTVVVRLRHGREAVGLLRLAADKAIRRGTGLCVVHAHAAGVTREQAGAELDHLLDQAGLDPTLPIVRVVTPEAPAEALLGLTVDAAHGPVLLVPDVVCRAAAVGAAPVSAQEQQS